MTTAQRLEGTNHITLRGRKVYLRFRSGMRKNNIVRSTYSRYQWSRWFTRDRIPEARSRKLLTHLRFR